MRCPFVRADRAVLAKERRPLPRLRRRLERRNLRHTHGHENARDGQQRRINRHDDMPDFFHREAHDHHHRGIGQAAQRADGRIRVAVVREAADQPGVQHRRERLLDKAQRDVKRAQQPERGRKVNAQLQENRRAHAEYKHAPVVLPLIAQRTEDKLPRAGAGHHQSEHQPRARRAHAPHGCEIGHHVGVERAARHPVEHLEQRKAALQRLIVRH